MDNEVVVQRDLIGEGFLFSGDKLMVFDLQVVILNECFSLEFQSGHIELCFVIPIPVTPQAYKIENIAD